MLKLKDWFYKPRNLLWTESQTWLPPWDTPSIQPGQGDTLKCNELIPLFQKLFTYLRETLISFCPFSVAQIQGMGCFQKKIYPKLE